MSLRTRLANSGCEASNTAQEATRRRYAGASQQLIDGSHAAGRACGLSAARANVATREINRVRAEVPIEGRCPRQPEYPYAEAADGRPRPARRERRERLRGESLRGSAREV